MLSFNDDHDSTKERRTKSVERRHRVFCDVYFLSGGLHRPHAIQLTKDILGIEDSDYNDSVRTFKKILS